MASTQNPGDGFFVAQEVVCTYPMSDFYGPSPRYLYYGMLVATFATHWHGWLANVFLGASATYAGTAAIQAFILMSSSRALPSAQTVSIPRISPTNFTQTVSGMDAIVMNQDAVSIQPDVIELDVDAITAIVVVGFLVGLPMQCWSRVTRTRRVLHLLIFVWNVVMLLATVFTLTLWPTLNIAKEQYRFCFPFAPDDDKQSNNGWPSEFWQGSFNATVQYIFSNPESVWEKLPDNCFYPCFNTSQILRKQDSIQASLNTSSAASNSLHMANRYGEDPFLPFIYTAVAAFTVAYIFLVVAERINWNRRFPMDDPIMLWVERGAIWHSFRSDFCEGVMAFLRSIRHPISSFRRLSLIGTWTATKSLIHYIFDLVTLLVVLVSLFLCPPTIVCFICWIEWYIRHDGPTSESAQQVGQWTAPVSLALVLIAALILKLRYTLASEKELRRDVERARRKLDELEMRLKSKMEAKKAKRRRSSVRDAYEL